MNIPKQVMQRLEGAISDAFSEEIITEIKIEDVSIDPDAGEIRITLTVSTAVDPNAFAEGYFGLTGKVRRSLADKGDKWSRLFPIITPTTGQEVHA